MKITDILKEGDFGDLGLKGLGAELDKDDDYNPETDKFSMSQQLGKVLDSRGNPNPMNSVETRDGAEVQLTMDQAANLMSLLKRPPVNGTDTEEKKQFQRDISKKDGLMPFLDANDGKTMQQLYVTKYMSDTTKMALGSRSNRSNYT